MEAVTDPAPSGHRLLLAADAFLFSGALDLSSTGIFVGVLALARVDVTRFGESMGPVLGSVLSLITSGVLVLGGALVAWRMSGRRLGWGTVGGMLLGVVVGVPVAMALFVLGASLLSQLSRSVPMLGGRNGPPWLTLGVLALVALAFMAVPIVDAARDLARGRRAHVALDWTRLAALSVIVVLGGLLLPAVGAAQNNEIGEAGAFMVPFGGAGALAVTGAELLRGRRERRERRESRSASHHE
jgi:hypothetical protein